VSAVASSYYKDVTDRFAAYVQGEEDRAQEVQCLCVEAAAAFRQSNHLPHPLHGIKMLMLRVLSHA
jgi:hypothetical protein